MKYIEIIDLFYWQRAYKIHKNFEEDDDEISVKIYACKGDDESECIFDIYTASQGKKYAKDNELSGENLSEFKEYYSDLINKKQKYFIANIDYVSTGAYIDECYNILKDKSKGIYDIAPAKPKIHIISVFINNTDLYDPYILKSTVKWLYEEIFATKAQFDYLEPTPTYEQVKEDYNNALDSGLGSGFLTLDYLENKLF